MADPYRELFDPPGSVKPEPDPPVQWAMKHWGDFSEENKAELTKHLSRLDDAQRTAYQKYLIEWCGVPGEFFK